MKDESFREFVLDQLSGLDGLTARAMFGGHGLYCGKAFFGIVYRGRLYLKTNDATAPEFLRRGMEPFRPNGRQTMKYHEVPPDILEDGRALLEWAHRSIDIALALDAK